MISGLIQGTRNRDMTFNAGAGTAPGHKACINSCCCFFPSHFFAMNRVMMEIVPQLHLHLGDLSSSGCYWVILGCMQKAHIKWLLLKLHVMPHAQKTCCKILLGNYCRPWIYWKYNVESLGTIFYTQRLRIIKIFKSASNLCLKILQLEDLVSIFCVGQRLFFWVVGISSIQLSRSTKKPI